jgi:hypothetical protein
MFFFAGMNGIKRAAPVAGGRFDFALIYFLTGKGHRHDVAGDADLLVVQQAERPVFPQLGLAGHGHVEYLFFGQRGG